MKGVDRAHSGDVGGVYIRKKGRDNALVPIQKITLTLPQLETLYPGKADWSSYYEQLNQANSLAAMVLIVLQLGLMFARVTLEAHLHSLSQQPTPWPDCSVCGRAIRSKGFRSRQMQTLVGQIA